jgi:uncharacterized protein (DUF736 family)
MAYEDFPNSGALFAEKAKKHPKAPDYKGMFKLNVADVEIKDGTIEFKIGGWKKVSAKGVTFLSLKLDNYVPKPKPELHEHESGSLNEEDPF